MPARYFLGSQFLGVGAISYWSDIEVNATSLLYVCPQCGDAWARIAIDGTEWLPIRMPCRKHEFPTSDCGGSFLPKWLQRIEELPPEVLRYEAKLRLDKEKE